MNKSALTCAAEEELKALLYTPSSQHASAPNLRGPCAPTRMWHNLEIFGTPSGKSTSEAKFTFLKD